MALPNNSMQPTALRAAADAGRWADGVDVEQREISLVGDVMSADSQDPTAVIIGMERAALDRWGKGDPSGFLEISAPDVVYFDPYLERRLDGREALADYYEGIRGKVSISRYELASPRVQLVGSAAVLTFNFVSYGGGEDVYRWNCTEVYRRARHGWEIIQTHWSFTKGARG